MKRFFVQTPKTGEPVLLSAEESRHAIRVLRLRPGDRILLFDGSGQEWAAKVENTDKQVLVLPEKPRPGIAHTGVTIAGACPKGKRLEVMIEKLAELGACAFRPVRFERSVVSLTPSRRERLERMARAASKQCGRADLLQIEEETRPADLTGPRLFLADPASRAAPPAPEKKPVTILIGPEGGLTETEQNLLLQSGAVTFGLGPRILRIETAAIACAALFAQNHA